MQFFEIHLEDQIPVFGAGRRIVLAEIGRKWVHMCTFSLDSGRMHVQEFELACIKEVFPTPKDLKAIKKNLKAKMKHANTNAMVRGWIKEL